MTALDGSASKCFHVRGLLARMYKSTFTTFAAGLCQKIGLTIASDSSICEEPAALNAAGLCRITLPLVATTPFVQRSAVLIIVRMR